MTNSELIKLCKKYFSKDKTELKQIVLGFEFTGREYKNWKKWTSTIVGSQPFDVSFRMMKEATELIIAKKYNEIDWNFLGDLSWEIEILLNENIVKGYDWDKVLCSKCNGTARIFKIYISDIIPAFTYETFSMTYSKSGNYYEFQPINNLSDREENIVNKIVDALNIKGYFFVSKKIISKRLKSLYSDCHTEGNASIFDVLFSDVHNIQDRIERFSDNSIKDVFGKEISWREFYDENGNLTKRLEFHYFTSKNVLEIETNSKHEIVNVTVCKDTKKQTHQKFRLKLPPQYSSPNQ
ncbi:MAG: hypothetical protein JNL70_23930 [Saprospiraceae bacterium]|nr:hypothetical protein [Saprospiraceae bacterium]